MKPVPGRINPLTENFISIVERSEPYFTNVFHFHEECELVYVMESCGKRIIGDNISPFDKGDIVFVGANLPHVWYNDKEYFQADSKLKARAIVAYFLQDIFGQKFFTLKETQQLADFFQRAKRGIIVYGQTRKQIAREMKMLPGKKGMDRIIRLLRILQIFSETTEFRYLAGIGYSHAYNTKDNHKIDKVFRFVLNNYHKNISLEEAAAVVQLTPQSFCRFFRNRTQKPFVHFVNEVRIGQVCKKLTEEDWSIAEVAYSCGFSNLSNFNRFFKMFTGKTPSLYQREVQMRKQ